MTNDTEKALELALAHLDKQFGKGTVMRMNDPPQSWPAISTGSIGLDRALGIGGWPKGRIVELFGAESTGKSTLCLAAIANAQKQGGKCLFIDAEHALDPLYAQNLGVDIPSLLLSQPDHGEQAIDILETVVKTGAISLAVVDSVAALVPQDELDGDMSKQHMGLQARLMSKAMRKLHGPASTTKTLIIFTNQLREKVGIVFGNPIVQPGGRALKFQASVRVELSKAGDLKSKEDGSMEGIRVRAKIPKNKLAPAYRQTEYDIIYGRGINWLGEIVDLGADLGILTKTGNWYNYKDQQLGNGRTKTIEFLASDLDLMERIKKEIL